MLAYEHLKPGLFRIEMAVAPARPTVLVLKAQPGCCTAVQACIYRIVRRSGRRGGPSGHNGPRAHLPSSVAANHREATAFIGFPE